jgi:hypothetical protein
MLGLRCYDVSMRTTLTIDDDLAATLKESSRRSGRPFKQLLNETLRAGLQAQQAPPRPKRYRIRPKALGGVVPGLDLDKALRLADALEDEAIARELEARR